MNILITGAARGLGLSMLLEAVQRGYQVYATVRNKTDEEKIFSHLLEHQHQLVTCLVLDVSDEKKIHEAAQKLKLLNITLDVIINNAAVLLARQTDITELSYEELKTSFEVNLFGAMMVVKHFLPLLSSGNSKILNISSEAGSIKNAYAGDFPYTLSKCALNLFSEQLKRALRAENKEVWSIHPGWMKTDMGGPNAAIEASYSAASIIDIADGSLKVLSEQSFINFKGEPMEI